MISSGKFIKKVKKILKPLFTTCKVMVEGGNFICTRKDGTGVFEHSLADNEEDFLISELVRELKSRDNMVKVVLDSGQDVYLFKKVSSRRVVVLDNGKTSVVRLNGNVGEDKGVLEELVRESYRNSEVIQSSRSRLEV